MKNKLFVLSKVAAGVALLALICRLVFIDADIQAYAYYTLDIEHYTVFCIDFLANIAALLFFIAIATASRKTALAGYVGISSSVSYILANILHLSSRLIWENREKLAEDPDFAYYESRESILELAKEANNAWYIGNMFANLGFILLVVAIAMLLIQMKNHGFFRVSVFLILLSLIQIQISKYFPIWPTYDAFESSEDYHNAVEDVEEIRAMLNYFANILILSTIILAMIAWPRQIDKTAATEPVPVPPVPVPPTPVQPALLKASTQTAVAETVPAAEEAVPVNEEGAPADDGAAIGIDAKKSEIEQLKAEIERIKEQLNKA